MSKPYYQDDYVTLWHGDSLEILPTLAGGESVQSVITDPPYNIGKASWDFIENYEAWCAEWVIGASRALTPDGGFWCFHSEPLVLARIVEQIQGEGRKLVSWVTLDKSSWGIAKRYANAGTKTFPASVEYAAYSRAEVYADQIRALRETLGLTRGEFDMEVSPSRKPTGITYRWEKGERIPQAREVELIREKWGVELSIPAFSNPAKHSVVWQFPQPDTTDHPTAKPLSIMERMVESTTNVGDTILDPFAGSGATLVAAKNLGRKAVGVELDEKYCEVIAKRCAQDLLELEWTA